MTQTQQTGEITWKNQEAESHEEGFLAKARGTTAKAEEKSKRKPEARQAMGSYRGSADPARWDQRDPVPSRGHHPNPKPPRPALAPLLPHRESQNGSGGKGSLEAMQPNPPTASRDIFNWTRLLRAFSKLDMNVSRHGA